MIADGDIQTDGSTATLEHHADGVTITVRPLGLRRFFKDGLLVRILVVIVALSSWIVASAPGAVARGGLFGLLAIDVSVPGQPALRLAPRRSDRFGLLL